MPFWRLCPYREQHMRWRSGWHDCPSVLSDKLLVEEAAPLRAWPGAREGPLDLHRRAGTTGAARTALTPAVQARDRCVPAGHPPSAHEQHVPQPHWFQAHSERGDVLW